MFLLSSIQSISQGTHRFFAELNSTYDLEFPSSGITDYLVIEDPFGDRNLTAVTISMWMKTNDKNNQGTPVSYATDTYDNALVITDYTGYFLFFADQNLEILHVPSLLQLGFFFSHSLAFDSKKCLVSKKFI